MRTLKASFCCLLLVTSSAWAEWVLVAETNIRNGYIDPSTIRMDGNLRKVWAILDFKQRNGAGWMSARTRNEYDCQGERYRLLSISGHSEPMAGGTILYTSNFEKPEPWKDIPPGSDIDAIMKILCAK